MARKLSSDAANKGVVAEGTKGKGAQVAAQEAAASMAQSPVEMLAAQHEGDASWLKESEEIWNKRKLEEEMAEAEKAQGEQVLDLSMTESAVGFTGQSLLVAQAVPGTAALLIPSAETVAVAGGIFGTGIELVPLLLVTGGAAVVISNNDGDGGAAAPTVTCAPIEVLSTDEEDGENIVVLEVGDEGPYNDITVLAVNSEDTAVLFSSDDVVVELCNEHPADISVNAQGVSSEAFLGMVATGSIGSIDVVASNFNAGASADISSVSDDSAPGLAIFGDILVSATSEDSGAHLSMGEDSGVQIVLGAGDDETSIMITATSEDSSASAYIAAFGDGQQLGDVYVMASSLDSNASLFMGVSGDGVTVEGDFVVQASGVSADAGALYFVDADMVGYIDVVASAASADAGAAMLITGDLDGSINVSASAVSADAQLVGGFFSSADSQIWGDLTGNISVTASALSAEADLSLFISGDMTGDLSVTASSQDASADVELAIGGDLTGDIDVTASADDSYATADVSVFGMLSGDLTVMASAFSSIASLDISVSSDVMGDLTVTASSDEADAGLVLDIFSGDLDGDLVATASANDADSIMYVTVNSGDINGDITATANSDNADVYMRVTADASFEAGGSISGDIAATASALGSYVSLSVNASDDIEGNIDLMASGISSEVYANGIYTADGSLIGNVSAEASNTYSNVDVFMDIGDFVSGDVTLMASGNGSLVSADILIGGNMSGDVTLETSGGVAGLADYAEGYLSLDINGNMEGDLSVLATGSSAYATADVSIGGSMSGDIDVTASGAYTVGGNYAESHLSIDIDDNMMGDLTVLSSNNSSDATVDMYVGGYMSGDITSTASDTVASADIQLEIDGGYSGDIHSTASAASADSEIDISVSADVLGDVTVLSSAHNSYADMYMDIYGDAQNGADFTGDLLITASSQSSEAHLHLDLYAEGDITGDFTGVASGEDSYAHLVVNSWESGNISGDLTGTASGVSSEMGIEMDIDGGNYQGDMVLTANEMFSFATLSMDIVGSFMGDLTMRATDLGAEVATADEFGYEVADVTGDFVGNINLQAGTVNAANTVGSDPSAEVNMQLAVGGDISGDVHAYAYGASLVSADISADRLLGDIDIKSANLEGGSFANVNVDVTTMTTIEYDDVQSQDVVTGAGSVFVQGGVGNDVDLHFEDGFASEIYLDATGDSSGIFYGEFDLTLGAADEDGLGWDIWWNAVNPNSAEGGDVFLADRMTTIYGFTDQSNILNDEDHVGFTFADYDNTWLDTGTTGSNDDDDTYNTFADGGNFTDLADFLFAADAALGDNQDDGVDSVDERDIEFYFGVVDGNGYLAADEDGDGISQLIEFVGFTDFDASNLYNASTAPTYGVV